MEVSTLPRHDLFIGGGARGSSSGGTFESEDPSTGQPWGLFAEAAEVDVDEAVRAAAKAFESGRWPAMAASERAAALRRMGASIADNAAELAELETSDNGKPIRHTRGELLSTTQWYWYYAGAADKIEGRHIPISRTLDAVTEREPIGVVAAIVPFNSPILLTSWKVAPALAAGNTIVIKPAPETPATALRIAQIASDVGFPPGVINVVTGGDPVGRALVEHKRVGKIAFTGASETGAQIASTAARTLKRVSVEGGGKSAHIIFPDASLSQALTAAAAGVFISAGQTCVAGSRLLVHASIYDEFVSGLASKATSLRLGPPMDPTTDVGPLSSREHRDRVLSHIQSAKDDGATVVVGGNPAEVPGRESGHYVQPTVIADADNSSRICQEEIFGPVVACLPFEDEDEAVEIANNVRYGLAGGVWTSDIGRARRVANGLRVGTVWVNNYRTIHWQAPFGGVKASGYGRENGLDTLSEFTQVKTVLTDFSATTFDPFAR